MLGETFPRTGAERRAEPRIACNNTQAEFTIIGTTVTTIPAVVVNISRSGLKLISNTRTSSGQQVRIKMEQFVIFGEVRHCRAQGPIFEVGIKISDVIGEHGICNRLTEEQIELLVIGKGLSTGERFLARWHIRRCTSCNERLQATKRFFSKLKVIRTPESRSRKLAARAGTER